MAVLRDTPYSSMNFSVDLGDGVDPESIEAGLTEVIFPEANIKTRHYRVGNDRSKATRKSQSVTRYSNLVLKRGLIGSLGWFEWWTRVRDGSRDAVRSVTINLLSEDRREVVMRWKFHNARPVNHTFSPFNAVDGGVVLETLELAFDDMRME